MQSIYIIFLFGYAFAGSRLISPLEEGSRLVSPLLEDSHLIKPHGEVFPKASIERDIISGDMNALKSLVETNLDIINNPEAKEQRQKLFLLAVRERKADVVDLFLKKVLIDVSSNDNEVIRIASANGDEKTVKLLLTRPEVNPGAKDDEALLVASVMGYTDVVRQLLAHPLVDPTSRDFNALKLASARNHGDIVKLFFQDGRITYKFAREYSLKLASSYGNVDLVRFLLSNPFFSQRRYIIDRIIFHGDLGTIKTIIEAGYKIDQKIIDKTLQNAKLRNRYDVVQFLESLKETTSV